VLLILSDYISYFVYLQVSRGLFEAHRLIFSFLICASIMRHRGLVPFSQWNFLLRGAGAMTGQIECGANPAEGWVTPAAWELLNALETQVTHSCIRTVFACTVWAFQWGPTS
jgi:dynein heavy chain